MAILYLNNASTTKPDKEVLRDFMWCAETYWQNPSDVSDGGLEARDIIKTAQIQIACSIKAKPEEIIFTSGGSESNNWAIKGFLDKNKDYKTIITTKLEHPSVYNTCQYMEKHGCKVLYVQVDGCGRVDIRNLEKLIKDSQEKSITRPFVSIMFANNEIGTIQDIKKISEVVHKYNGVFHCDAVQAYLHTEIDVKDLGIDMMSVSFHKFGGFKNCGFLYVKKGIELTPLIHGGHQFDSKRAGTENIPMIHAMGNQVLRYMDDISIFEERIRDLFDYTMFRIYDRCCFDCEIHLNGSPYYRMFNNISMTFSGINASKLISLLELRGICVSAGSACQAGENTPSRVLKEIGLSDEDAFSTIRISLNKDTTKDEIDYFVNALYESIQSLKMFG
jgi:cysteine desulfurase